MDLILFGMQGSGKGTQSEFIAEKFDFKVFETGQELRSLAQEDSPLGHKIKEIIEAGHLVPTAVVIDIIKNFTSQLRPGVKALFDGIPRSIEQAREFNKLMHELNRDFSGLHIKISEEEALKRLTTRRICKNCKAVYPVFYKDTNCEKCEGELITRADDNVESIQNRLKAYRDETIPVIETYQAQELMIEINGEQPIEGVTQKIMEKLTPMYR